MRLNTSKPTLKMTDEECRLRKARPPRSSDPKDYTPVYITTEMEEEARKNGESWIEDITTNSRLKNRGERGND